MDPTELLSQARDVMSVKRVFGDPIEKDGLTIIPVARVMGGAGGGGTVTSEAAEGSTGAATTPGMGVGFGVAASPAGVYVIRGDRVTWQPAYDVQRLALIGGLVGIVAMLVIRSIVRSVVDAR
jgi:uncharacterized spore protein YtfJ